MPADLQLAARLAGSASSAGNAGRGDPGDGDYENPDGADSDSSGLAVAGGSDGPRGQTVGPDEGDSLLYKLRRLVPLIVFGAFGGGLLLPNLTYIGLNFFARKHTQLPPDQIHCELDMKQAFCREAVPENTAWTTTLAGMATVVHFILGPTVGGLADALGRRRVLLFCSVLEILPAWGMFLHAVMGMSLYVVFFLTIFADIPSTAVFFSVCIDIVRPDERAAAFGLVLATAQLAGMAGFIAGFGLTMRGSVIGSTIFYTASVCTMFCLLPETLPISKRRALESVPLVPGCGLAILMRDGLFRRLAFCVILSTFVGSGITVFATSFSQEFLDFTREAQLQFGLASALSVLLWLFFGLHTIIERFGEVGALKLALVASALFCVMYPLAQDVAQVVSLVFMMGGPMALAFPATSALKSRIAQEHEQGELQGALTAAKSLAAGCGPVVFGGLFTFCMRVGGRPVMPVVFFLGGALVLPLLATLSRVRWLLGERPATYATLDD